MSEKVLCIKAGLYEDITESLKYGLFLPREQVENDPAYHQVIPYVVIQDYLENLVASYRRPAKGGDSRLSGKRSIGIGGHVNLSDRSALYEHGESMARAAITTGARREIAEEIGVEVSAWLFSSQGSLRATVTGKEIYLGHQSSNPVDQVHVGLLGLVLAKRQFQPAGEITSFDWITPEEVIALADEFEGWSVKAAELILGMEDKTW